MRRFVVLAAASAACVATPMVGAAPAPASTRAQSNHFYADYLGGTSTRTAGQDQCVKAISQRTGNWACVGGRPKALPRSGWCFTAGCWYDFTATDSEYYGDVYFGTNTRALGSVDLYYRVNPSGGTAVTKARIIPTTNLFVDHLRG